MSLLTIRSKTHISFSFLKNENKVYLNSFPEGNWVLLVRTSSITGNWNLKGTLSNHDFWECTNLNVPLLLLNPLSKPPVSVVRRPSVIEMHIKGPKVWDSLAGGVGTGSPSLWRLTPSPLSLPSILAGCLQWSECQILSILFTPGFPGG